MTASRSRPDRSSRPGRLSTGWHLTRRFFGFVTARSLAPREQAEVVGLLRPVEAELFWQQSRPDQRHALIVARRVLRRRPGDRVAGAAALLHDIGKRSVNLGAVRRSIATVLGRGKLPMTAAHRAYRDHGPRGAIDLEDAGCGVLVVEFARRHPGPPPDGIDPDQWRALLAADHG